MTQRLKNRAMRDAVTGQRFVLRGVVQGVGLRPAVFRLAARLKLGGKIHNASGGVAVEVEGPPERVAEFARELPAILPSAAQVYEIRQEHFHPNGRSNFQIEANEADGPVAVAAPPDRRTCDDCLNESTDDSSKSRFRYAFTSCTDCGPRYSILSALPFERDATSMIDFPLCSRCAVEYRSPSDRRFHAETNSCRECGPRIWTAEQAGERRTGNWLNVVTTALEGGKTVAIKGLGGYQLWCDATCSGAVHRLRQRKRRRLKPLALLVESLDHAERIVHLDAAERAALLSPENPIVLARARANHGLPADIACGLDTIGVMLPTTTLHWLIARQFGKPFVCTSGNREGEPLEYEIASAEKNLDGVADVWLHHDRRIVRPIDDSVVRVIAGKTATIRLARGLAPLPLSFLSRPMLAVGGQQKVAAAWSNGVQSALGPHLGDMDSVGTRERFAAHIVDLKQLFDFKPETIVHDAHPDYFTSHWAIEQSAKRIPVYHHHAHVVAGMIEEGWLDREVLGVAWDGTGYGPDGSIWGGEFLKTSASCSRRIACLRRFRLPGGETAVREPWRVAAVLLEESVGREKTMRLLARRGCERIVPVLEIAKHGRFSPLTSSAGRLFDAVASILLGIDDEGHDGWPAMLLEAACDRSDSLRYPLPVVAGPVAELDWRPMIAGIVHDLECGESPAALAMRFHRSLAHGIAAACQLEPNLPIVLCGGVFQNRILTELAVEELGDRRQIGLAGRIPVNDGGLAAGQLAIALAQLQENRPCASVFLEK